MAILALLAATTLAGCDAPSVTDTPAWAANEATVDYLLGDDILQVSTHTGTIPHGYFQGRPGLAFDIVSQTYPLTSAWQDVGTGLPAIYEFKDPHQPRVVYVDPSMQAWVHDGLFGPAPFMLPGLVQSRLDGCNVVPIYEATIQVCRDPTDGRVSIEFPQYEVVERAQQRSTSFTLLEDCPFPSKFGDLVGLGYGWVEASMIRCEPGLAVEPTGAQPASRCNALAEQGPRTEGLPIDFDDARGIAQSAPGLRTFLAMHPDAIIGAARFGFEPAPEWVITWFTTTGNASYNVDPVSHDVQVSGIGIGDFYVPTVTAEGDIVTDLPALYPLAAKPNHPNCNLADVIAKAYGRHQEQLVVVYRVLLDPQTYKTGHEESLLAVNRSSQEGERWSTSTGLPLEA